MNAVEIKCCQCDKPMLISADELMIFEKGTCDDCDTRSRKFIRHKIVYEWNTMDDYRMKLAEKIINKDTERRRYPRINLIKGD